MHETKNRPVASARPMVSLLRWMMGRAVCATGSDPSGDMLTLSAPDTASRPVPRALLGRAAAQGLISRRGAVLSVTPEAEAFVRRALIEPDRAFQDQHRDLREAQMLVDGARQAVRVNDAESPLAAIARLKDRAGRPFLPDEAVGAGERLAADFTRGQMQPRLTMSYAPKLASRQKRSAGGTGDLSDTALSARRRVDGAVDAMGPELAGVALDVCCFMKGLELVERERQWPARSAKLMLRTALLALARHYAPPARSARKTHAWGADGYRPEMPDR